MVCTPCTLGSNHQPRGAQPSESQILTEESQIAAPKVKSPDGASRLLGRVETPHSGPYDANNLPPSPPMSFSALSSPHQLASSTTRT